MQLKQLNLDGELAKLLEVMKNGSIDINSLRNKLNGNDNLVGKSQYDGNVPTVK